MTEQIRVNRKENIRQVMDDYAHELVPVVVPLTLIHHYVCIYNLPHIRDQIYPNPHPKELMLKNHV